MAERKEVYIVGSNTARVAALAATLRAQGHGADEGARTSDWPTRLDSTERFVWLAEPGESVPWEVGYVIGRGIPIEYVAADGFCVEPLYPDDRFDADADYAASLGRVRRPQAILGDDINAWTIGSAVRGLPRARRYAAKLCAAHDTPRVRELICAAVAGAHGMEPDITFLPCDGERSRIEPEPG